MASIFESVFEMQGFLEKSGRKLPKKLRGMNKELSQLYNRRDPAEWLLAVVVASAARNRRGAFYLTRDVLSEIAHDDPNIRRVNVKRHYPRFRALLRTKAEICDCKGKAAIVVLNSDVLALIGVPPELASKQKLDLFANRGEPKPDEPNTDNNHSD